MMVPGDNEHQAAGLVDVLSAVGKADIVIPYVAFQPEILVKLLKRRNSYVEVGTIIDKRKAGKSKIFQPKNLLSVMRTILHLARIV